jgi:hypothetical protein
MYSARSTRGFFTIIFDARLMPDHLHLLRQGTHTSTDLTPLIRVPKSRTASSPWRASAISESSWLRLRGLYGLAVRLHLTKKSKGVILHWLGEPGVVQALGEILAARDDVLGEVSDGLAFGGVRTIFGD